MNKSIFKIHLPALLTKFNYKYDKLNDNIISIKLPLFCSIRIAHKGEGITFTPFFGNVNRYRAIWIEFILFIVLALISFHTNVIDNSELYVIAFLIIASSWEVFRFILTESCITRLQIMLKNE